MKRSQMILCAILALQIGLAVWAFWPRQAETAAADALLPDLAASDIVALTIADDTGAELPLRHVAGEWQLPDADGFPAQAERVTQVLEQLVAITKTNLVAQTETSHRQLQVADDEFLRRVELETDDGASHTLYLGSPPDYGSAHVRVGGQDEVYLARRLNVWDVAPNANLFIDTLYLSVAQDTVSRVTLENTSGTFEFEPGETGEDGSITWSLAGLEEGETLAADGVQQIIQAATYLNMVEPLGKSEEPGYGLAEPRALVTLETSAGPVTLAVGAADEGAQYAVVKASSNPYYAHVSELSVSSLVEATRETLVPPVTGTGASQ